MRMTNLPLAPEALFRPGGRLTGPPIQLPLFVDEQRLAPWVIRLHRSSFLRYDFRLQVCGALASFVLLEVPSLDPDRPVTAEMVGNHDRKFMLSERVIKEGQYDAGPTMPVDTGVFAPLIRRYAVHDLEIIDQLACGDLQLRLTGHYMKGGWRMTGRGTKWLLQKMPDEHASATEVLKLDVSVVTGKRLDELR